MIFHLPLLMISPGLGLMFIFPFLVVIGSILGILLKNEPSEALEHHLKIGESIQPSYLVESQYQKNLTNLDKKTLTTIIEPILFNEEDLSQLKTLINDVGSNKLSTKILKKAIIDNRASIMERLINIF